MRSARSAVPEPVATSALPPPHRRAPAFPRPRASQRAPDAGAHKGACAHAAHGLGPSLPFLLTLYKGDQVIRGNPASRGTKISAEVLVGPPWRMESNAGQQVGVGVGVGLGVGIGLGLDSSTRGLVVRLQPELL